MIHDLSHCTSTRYAIHPALVAIYGIAENAHADTFQAVLTIDDLFSSPLRTGMGGSSRSGFLHSSFAHNHRDDGLEQDPDIQSQAPSGDIIRVQFDDFLKVADLAAAADLPHTGQSRFEGQAGTVVVFVLFPLVRGRRPCSDQAHISDEDIEALRQFVNTPVSDLLSDPPLVGTVRTDFVPDDPGIEVKLEHPSVCDPILCHELFLSLLRIRIHAADLIHEEPSLNRVYSRKLSATCCG